MSSATFTPMQHMRVWQGCSSAAGVDALITQNVDRLHQKGGATDVIELHGTTHMYATFLAHSDGIEASSHRILPSCPVTITFDSAKKPWLESTGC